jgi:hypothetical protein
MEGGAVERPRFFPRQLITPDDLTLGQDYARNKLRRHNRYLHGWGVVCGARVVIPATPRPWKLVIRPGYILGPFGDEIIFDHEICFDVRVRCLAAASGDACDEIVDPLCPEQTLPPRRAATPWFVVVRYKEMAARPVRVSPVGCGCDDTLCEYSRWRDGYEICVLDQCPPSHQGTPPAWPDLVTTHGIPECPPCPTDPWVVLARVTVDDKGAITEIDNCSCRRMVLSLAPFWTRCNDPVITGGTSSSETGGRLTPPVS